MLIGCAIPSSRDGNEGIRRIGEPHLELLRRVSPLILDASRTICTELSMALLAISSKTGA